MITEPSRDAAALKPDYIRAVLSEDWPEPLACQLLLPKDWRVVSPTPALPAPGNELSLVLEASPLGPGAPGEIVVLVAVIEREAAPADILHSFLSQQSYVVSDRRETVSAFGRVADVVAWRDQDGERFDVRARCVRSGVNAFFVLGIVKGGRSNDDLDDAFFLAGETFELLNPSPSPYAEPFSLLAWSGLTFALPDSWSPSRLRTEDAVAWQSPAIRKRGDSSMIAFSRADIDHAGRIASEMVATLSGVADAPPRLRPVDESVLLATADESWSVRHLEAEQGLLRYAVAIAEPADAAHARVLLVSPRRSDDPASWAHGRRVFEIALDRMGPAEGVT